MSATNGDGQHDQDRVREFRLPDGKTYRVPICRMKGRKQLQAWVNRQPRPQAPPTPDLTGMSANDRFAFLQQVQMSFAIWPPDAMSAEGANLILTTPGGDVELLHVALQRFHPEVGREDCEALVEDMEYGQFVELATYFLHGVEPEERDLESRLRQVQPGLTGNRVRAAIKHLTREELHKVADMILDAEGRRFGVAGPKSGGSDGSDSDPSTTGSTTTPSASTSG